MAGRAPADAARASFRPDIQALRALAVASVLLYHLWPNRLTGGFVGVDVFFVISGYLITSHLIRERHRTGRIALGAFWARRAARLLPASLLVLAVTAIAVVVVVPTALWRQFLGDITASALYIENWRLLVDSVDYLAAENQASPVQHFWTLSAEEQFYVLLPLLLVMTMALFRRFPWRRVILVAIAVATVASFAHSVWLLAAAPGQAYFSTFSRAWEFGAGALLAFAPPLTSGRAGAVVSTAGVAAIAWSTVGLSGADPFPGAWALVPVVGTAAAIWGGAHAPLAAAGRLAPVAFLGRVSYAVYLWHWPLIVLVPFATSRALTTLDKVAIAAVAIALAWASTVFVEDRVRSSPRLLHGRRPRTIAAWSAAGMAAVLVLSLGGVAGLVRSEERVVEATQALVADPPPCFGAAAMAPDCRPDGSDPSDAAVADAGVDVVPALGDIASDDGNAPGCWAKPEEADVHMCTLGAEDAPVRIIAVGDSHNNAMIPAYEAVAEQLGWRIDVAGHAGCPWTTEDLELATDEQTEACETWRGHLADLIAEAGDDVDGILVASSAGAEPADDAQVRGLVEAWALRPDVSVPVLALIDNPRYPESPVACVSEDPTTATARCALPRAEALVDDGKRRAVEQSENARAIDLTDAYCTEAACPPVIGGVAVYRDAHHLSATYAATVGPLLADELREALLR
ncbi:acyltransferase family protein [Microbacterium excoecariae]|uniref:acyltransferase family protein n=1 Tax=Microbacterium excoecariae TaxID=2715210 RepID=UPI001408515A|nr:acyltransferase [Microbacterium excoecariae]